VAGLGFLAAIFSAAIAPASISTAIATAIARLRLKVLFIFQKQQKQKKTRPLHCTICPSMFFFFPEGSRWETREKTAKRETHQVCPGSPGRI